MALSPTEDGFEWKSVMPARGFRPSNCRTSSRKFYQADNQGSARFFSKNRA